MSKIYTRGNIIVEDIKVGDIHYEYEWGLGIKSKVISLPMRNNDGLWTWQSKNVTDDTIIDYAIHEDYAHYGPKLYDYEAYKNIRFI